MKKTNNKEKRRKIREVLVESVLYDFLEDIYNRLNPEKAIRRAIKEIKRLYGYKEIYEKDDGTMIYVAKAKDKNGNM